MRDAFLKQLEELHKMLAEMGNKDVIKKWNSLSLSVQVLPEFQQPFMLIVRHFQDMFLYSP